MYSAQAKYFGGCRVSGIEAEGSIRLTSEKIEFYTIGSTQPMVVILLDSINEINLSSEGIPRRKVLSERLSGRKFIQIFVSDCPRPHVFSMKSEEATKLLDHINAQINARRKVVEISDIIENRLREYEGKVDELMSRIESIKNQTAEEILSDFEKFFGEISKLRDEFRRMKDEYSEKINEVASESATSVRGMTDTILSKLDQVSSRLTELERKFNQVFFGKLPEHRISQIGLISPKSLGDIVSYLNNRFVEPYLGAILLFGTTAIYGGGSTYLRGNIWNRGSIGVIGKIYNFLAGSNKKLKVVCIDNYQDLNPLFNQIQSGIGQHQNNPNVELNIIDVSVTGLGRMLNQLFNRNNAGSIHHAINVINNNVLNYVRSGIPTNAFVTIHSIGATSKLGDIFGLKILSGLISPREGMGLSIGILKPLLNRDNEGLCIDYLVNLWFLMQDETFSRYRKAIVIDNNLEEATKTANRLAFCHLLTFGTAPYSLPGVYSNILRSDLLNYLNIIRNILNKDDRLINVRGALISFADSSEISYPAELDVALIRNQINETISGVFENIINSVGVISSTETSQYVKGLIAQVWIKTRYLPENVDYLIDSIKGIVGNYADMSIVHIINWNDNIEDFVVVEIIYDPEDWFISLLHSQPLNYIEGEILNNLSNALSNVGSGPLGSEIRTRGFKNMFRGFMELLNKENNQRKR